jgi:hypothetical protein
LAAALFAAAACTDDYYRGVIDTLPPAGLVEVTFSVAVPEHAAAALTRAADPDSRIETADLLVFDGDGPDAVFIERIAVDEISQEPGKPVWFSARIAASNDPRQFHIVANGRTGGGDDRVDYSILTPDVTTIAEAGDELQTLSMSTASIDEASLLPPVMWGRVSVDAIEANMPNINARLLRLAAAIRVCEGAPNATNGLNDFEIGSITLSGAAQAGFLRPDESAMGAAGMQVPLAPRPVDGTRIAYYRRNGADYDGYIARATPSAPNPVIYLYETDSDSEEELSLIVGGYWDGGATETYYRVTPDRPDPHTGKGTRAIVRNHRYTVTIVKVSGPGYATIEEAVAAPADNMQVALLEDNDAIHFVYGDSQNMLGASDNELRLYGTATGAAFEIATISSNHGRPLTVTHNVAGLSLPAQILSSGSDNLYTLTGTWTGTISGTGGTITVSDGSLKHEIHVLAASSIEDVPWIQGSGSFAYCPILTGSNVPWSAKIEGEPNSNNIDTTADNKNWNSSTQWELFGTANGHNLYLYTAKNGGGRITVLITYMDGGNFRKGRIIKNN